MISFYFATDQKIILAGGAGFVGYNLVSKLVEEGYHNLIVFDKCATRVARLINLHPSIQAKCQDLAQPGAWQDDFSQVDAVILLQAQIGGKDYKAFVRNNREATELILKTVKVHKIPYLIHISSSVVTSKIDDFYSVTKREQEKIVLESSLDSIILRPTLMFGPFDPKHLGYLARFMRSVPIFPIPGKGYYQRQPLYVGDFCNILIACLKSRKKGIYNISGQEFIYYKDMMKIMRHHIQARTVFVPVPYSLFYILLWVWSLFDSSPPFTTQQLAALAANEEFERIDWPNLFGVPFTPFTAALKEMSHSLVSH